MTLYIVNIVTIVGRRTESGGYVNSENFYTHNEDEAHEAYDDAVLSGDSLVVLSELDPHTLTCVELLRYEA